MKLNTFIATVMVVTLLAACTNNQKMNQDMKQAAFITADQTEEVIAQLKDSLGEASAFRIGRGVAQVGAVWRAADGDAEAFAQFCKR